MTDEMIARFVNARRAYISSQFKDLNTMQQQAVLTTDGPLLLLAGAGSGKTTVLINRIANLIKYGCGSDSNQVPDYVTAASVWKGKLVRLSVQDFQVKVWKQMLYRREKWVSLQMQAMIDHMSDIRLVYR